MENVIENPGEIALETLMPHRSSMLLLNGVKSLDADGESVVMRFRSTRDCVFYDDVIDGVPNWVAIELMAQACAALTGFHDLKLDPGSSSKPGLLLGTRKMKLDGEKFVIGAVYDVSAKREFGDDDIASFICDVKDADGNVVAAASLNAYRPADFKAFLSDTDN